MFNSFKIILNLAHLLTPTLRLSPISSRKKFCATNDSWQQIAKNKPHFPFPILKAAIKRNLTAPVNIFHYYRLLQTL